MTIRRGIRIALAPTAGALFITLWIVAEAGRGPAVPVIVVFGVAIGLSQLLPRVSLILVLVGELVAAGTSAVALSPQFAGVVHPITQTDWPLYAAALVVPALVAAGGSRRSLRPSLVATVLAAVGLAALLALASPDLRWAHGSMIRWLSDWPVATELRVFVTFGILLTVIGLALWAVGWVIAGVTRFLQTMLRDPLIRARFNEALKLGPAIEDAPRLTARERDVLLLVSDGHSNAEIAKALFLSEATVKSHLRSILSKLSLKSRTEIVAYAWRTGLVQVA